ncbi:GUN4 domain-containing protein [Brasilonema octagenarum]|uniref:GUN4 domain-containing protein n=1 Tax=Brasilonema octagenarum TaxID=417105 RepID=UPI002006DE86|nr:GUN4 domain-containing protein [Brasilonema octagenarum]
MVQPLWSIYLKIAVNPELLHFLRINFFLDPPEQLPYTVEFEFLTSGLCREIDAELYEIEPEIRNELLQELMKREDAKQRIQDVATLLWQYVEYHSPWADRVELERAQQLTALNFLDPAKAKEWLDEAEANPSLGRAEREWFIAMRQEIEELPDISTLSTEKQSEQNDLPSEKGVDYTRLRDLLKTGKWEEADNETFAVMLKAAGRKKEDGQLDVESIKNFPCTDLRTIDQLWVKYSNGRFGFSVQKRIWESVGGKPDANIKIWEKFSNRVGWRKGMFWNKFRLRYSMSNMRSSVTLLWNQEWLSYSELTFSTNAPRGHLPLTFAIGVQSFMGFERKYIQYGGEYLSARGRYATCIRLFSRVQTCKL